MSLLPSVRRSTKPPRTTTAKPLQNHPIPPSSHTTSTPHQSTSRSSLFKQQRQQHSSLDPATPSTTTSTAPLYDPKENAALQRNVESLTKVSRTNAKTIAALTQQVQVLHTQLRASQAETKAALHDAQQQQHQKPETTAPTTAALHRQVRELQQELVQSKRHSAELELEVQRLDAKHQHHLRNQSRKNGGSASSSGASDTSKLRQQLQTVSAHAKSLLVQNQALERERRTWQQNLTTTMELKDRLVHFKTLLEQEQRRSALAVDEKNTLATELHDCQKLCQASQARRQQHALDLSHRTEELLSLRNEYARLQQRLHHRSALSDTCDEQQEELARLARALEDARAALGVATSSQDTVEEERRRWEVRVKLGVVFVLVVLVAFSAGARLKRPVSRWAPLLYEKLSLVFIYRVLYLHEGI